MRAVLDPNVLVAALISPGGRPRAIVAAWTDGRFELTVSPALLGELRDVLSRPKFRRWVTSDTATLFIDGLRDDATIVDDPPSRPGASPDPDDDYLLALALSARADCLVSGDRDLTGLLDARPPVVTPRQFFEQLDNPDG